MHGTPKYPADFTHFDYVNPDAPKGGSIRLASEGSFDSFNPFIPKGDAFSNIGVETLLTSSADEPFTEYGLIAETLEVPADRSWVIFDLRPEARWHDGRPITADDVVWSLETLKAKGQPFYRFYYGSVASAERLGERRVKFTFTETGNRELPLIVGQLPVLPRHYWEGRDFESTTLEPPLASGPYRITEFEAGRFVVLERVKDYWGANLAVNRGENNFDRIRYDFYRDRTVIRQALKSGLVDFYEENQAKAWARDFDVPAVREGRLVKEAVGHRQPTGMQAFVMNTRRAVFADRRVRYAIAHAFDFEWTNEHLFFGQYVRTESYFSNSELAATGLPAGEELEMLERYRGRIPEEVFTTPYAAPSTDGSGWPRDNLRRAFALLADAGWVVRDLELAHRDTGEPLAFEILLYSPEFERVVLPFVRNLRRLGMAPRVRLVDRSQYINRLRSFDFDMIVGGWGQSNSPGNEQRSYWTTSAADSPAARNFAGVRDPVVDELVELVVMAPDRESLVARTRALDRVLLWGHYVVPNWHLSNDRLLYWNKFSRPAVTPDAGTSFSLWWYDADKAARLERGERVAEGPRR
ncbi:MAG: ABC transporter substrate-binding protein [Ectothiorhodospiraceae bacterium]|nr:ABC transporter substrate-binding protein [Chromatiales bacterium]MCP5156857.1 ABC transporter substrate-binding protein [Ectothiorhodospiraceae bacterium]